MSATPSYYNNTMNVRQAISDKAKRGATIAKTNVRLSSVQSSLFGMSASAYVKIIEN